MIESTENIKQPQVFPVNPIETSLPWLDTPCDKVTLHPQPSCDHVAQHLHTPSDLLTSNPHPPLDQLTSLAQPPSDQLTSHPQPPSDLLTSHPHPPSDHVMGGRKPGKALISLAKYITLTEKEQKKSRRALYRDFHSGKFGLSAEVLTIKKKRYYFVELNDPKIIEGAMMLKREEEILKMIKKRSIQIYIKVPMNMSQELNLISSIDNPGYERFHEFIRQSSGVDLRIKTGSNHIPWIKRRIKMRKEDYQKVLGIAKANELSVGKVIVAFLKSYFKVE